MINMPYIFSMSPGYIKKKKKLLEIQSTRMHSKNVFTKTNRPHGNDTQHILSTYVYTYIHSCTLRMQWTVSGIGRARPTATVTVTTTTKATNCTHLSIEEVRSSP